MKFMEPATTLVLMFYTHREPEFDNNSAKFSALLALRCENRAAVLGSVAEQFLDAEQLVVFRHPVGAAGRASFDLAGRQRDGEVGDRAVFGFPAAVAGDRCVAVTVGQLDRINRFGHRADLVDLDQDAVGDALVDAALESLDIGDEQVVADELDFVAELERHLLPCRPVIFAAAVFDAADRVLVAPIGEEVDHFIARQFFAIDCVLLSLAVVELSRSGVESDPDLFARFVARFVDRGHDHVECFLVALQVGCEAAFVTDGRVITFVREHFFQIVENLGAGPQCVTESLETERHDHEFLHVDIIVSVLATVDDVHHGSGQHPGTAAAEVAEERLVR